MDEFQHGGAREGAGRKPVHEGPTKVIRVPEARVLEIRQYLDQIKKPARNDVASITRLKPEHIMRFGCLAKVAAGFPSPHFSHIALFVNVLNSFNKRLKTRR